MPAPAAPRSAAISTRAVVTMIIVLAAVAFVLVAFSLFPGFAGKSLFNTNPGPTATPSGLLVPTSTLL
jgi:hypothetical protein